MNKNISIALTGASISALAFVAGSQYIKSQDKAEVSEKDLETVKNILKDSDVNTPINGEMIKFLSDEDGKIKGVNVEEILAASDEDDSTLFYNTFDIGVVNGGKGGNKISCHSNCHSNCHGSRSWR